MGSQTVEDLVRIRCQDAEQRKRRINKQRGKYDCQCTCTIRSRIFASIGSSWYLTAMEKVEACFQLVPSREGSYSGCARALLLHVAGLDIQEIYYTLVSDEELKDYNATMQVRDGYFILKTNVLFERHLFRQIAQNSDETVDQFVFRLRQRAVSCDFGAQQDEYIHDQLIDTCHSNYLRQKFLEKGGTVKLDDLLVIARAQEAVERQLKAIEGTTSASDVNTVCSEMEDSVVNIEDAISAASTAGLQTHTT